MVEFVIGVAVGAAFAPFWKMVWSFLETVPFIKKIVDKVSGMFTSSTK